MWWRSSRAPARLPSAASRTRCVIARQPGLPLIGCWWAAATPDPLCRQARGSGNDLRVKAKHLTNVLYLQAAGSWHAFKSASSFKASVKCPVWWAEQIEESAALQQNLRFR